MTALDEAIALIDSLCGTLKAEAASGSGAAPTPAPPAQIAPPVTQPWKTLASSAVPGS